MSRLCRPIQTTGSLPLSVIRGGREGVHRPESAHWCSKNAYVSPWGLNKLDPTPKVHDLGAFALWFLEPTVAFHKRGCKDHRGFLESLVVRPAIPRVRILMRIHNGSRPLPVYPPHPTSEVCLFIVQGEHCRRRRGGDMRMPSYSKKLPCRIP